MIWIILLFGLLAVFLSGIILGGILVTVIGWWWLKRTIKKFLDGTTVTIK